MKTMIWEASVPSKFHTNSLSVHYLHAAHEAAPALRLELIIEPHATAQAVAVPRPPAPVARAVFVRKEMAHYGHQSDRPARMLRTSQHIRKFLVVQEEQ